MPNLFGGIYRNRRVLITGHTGFKGSWISMWLMKLGADVIGYSLKPPTTPNLFDVCRLSSKVCTITGDVRNFKRVKNVFERHKPEIVFHMAAQSNVRYSYKSPMETYDTNVIGTMNVLEACRYASSIRAIVNITSDKCYDNLSSNSTFTEEDPLGGCDPYSSSKACAELVTRAYRKSFFDFVAGRKHHISIASARAGNVIGGGDWADERLIPDCVKAVLSKKLMVVRYPNAVRPWQHVLDPLCGYLMLGQRLYNNGYRFSGGWNFGPDKKDARTVRWVIERFMKTWETNISWIYDKSDNFYEARHLQLDCSKAQKVLGWLPKWRLPVAIKKAVDWYKAYSYGYDMFNLTLDQIDSYERNLSNKSICENKR